MERSPGRDKEFAVLPHRAVALFRVIEQLARGLDVAQLHREEREEAEAKLGERIECDAQRAVRLAADVVALLIFIRAAHKGRVSRSFGEN